MRFESTTRPINAHRTSNQLQCGACECDSAAPSPGAGKTGATGSSDLHGLVNGKKPQLNNLIAHHAAKICHGSKTAKAAQADCHSAQSALLKKVLQDGKITPKEVAQLKQAVDADNHDAGSGAGAHLSPVKGAGASDNSPDSDAQVTPASTPKSAPVTPPPVTTTPTPEAAPLTPPATAGTTATNDGSFSLGGTKVNIEGGTHAEQAKTRDLFQQMYQKDPGFRKGVNSKADSGLDITIEELSPGIAGVATIWGHDISLDPRYISANVIAHELAHNLGMNHGAQLYAFADTAAGAIA